MTDSSAAKAGDTVISIRGVSMSYSGRRVLDQVDLDIRRGEILVLLGGSGSGKTTLLKHVLGLAKPEAGSITINGVDITRCSQSELSAVRRRIGVAFQAGALFNSMSVEDNVALPLRELTGLADSTIKLVVWMNLVAVGLSHAGSLYPPELSGGMRKRAAVARAMALSPDVLILDEPSAGLDPIVSAGLDELMLFLKRSFGVTILVVTHEMESAFRIADRVAMLYQGRLIAVNKKEQFAGNAHPRIRQFLDRQPDAMPRVAAEEFIASYLRGSRHDSKTKVGVFVIASLLSLGSATYFVHNTQSGRAQVAYKTRLRYAGGITSGAAVLFGGIKVGQVTAVGAVVRRSDSNRNPICGEVRDSSEPEVDCNRGNRHCHDRSGAHDHDWQQ